MEALFNSVLADDLERSLRRLARSMRLALRTRSSAFGPGGRFGEVATQSCFRCHRRLRGLGFGTKANRCVLLGGFISFQLFTYMKSGRG